MQTSVYRVARILLTIQVSTVHSTECTMRHLDLNLFLRLFGGLHSTAAAGCMGCVLACHVWCTRQGQQAALPVIATDPTHADRTWCMFARHYLLFLPCAGVGSRSLHVVETCCSRLLTVDQSVALNPERYLSLFRLLLLLVVFKISAQPPRNENPLNLSQWILAELCGLQHVSSARSGPQRISLSIRLGHDESMAKRP